ncbi:MAG TPA: glycosyltransferase family 1 protein [Acidobacteriota bacterium]|nr:glycosyltransferase family 1 protein [Acidobacteriota bacterium]
MKICIDMRPALSQATGVGVYIENLVKSLADIDSENEYHLFSSSWKERFPDQKFGANFVIHDKHLPVTALNFAWHRLGWPPVEKLIGSKIDIAHSPGPLLLPSSHAHRITTMMDLYFYFHPEDTAREMRRDYKALVQKHCQKSDAIIAISEHTRQVLIEHLNIHPSRIYTIRLAVDPFFMQPVEDEDSRKLITRFGVSHPFFLFVGDFEPRKNLSVVLEAFQALNEEVELVIVGPQRWTAPALNGNGRIKRVGYVSREELRALYRKSIALVMPSREEGFGIPLLEAMASNTAVIGSDLPVFHEVSGDSFYPVPSNNVEAVCQAMRLMLFMPERRESLIRLGQERVKKFSWKETAQKTLELYKSL